MKYSYRIYDQTSAPVGSRPLLAGVQSAYGFIPNSLGVMAESPAALEAYLTLNRLMEQTAFSTEERFVVMLAASRESECPYCIPAVSALAKMHGVAPEVVKAVRERRPLTEAKTNTLRQFTERLVRRQGWVSAEDIDGLLAAGYTRRHVFEVILIVMTKFLAIYSNHATNPPLDAAFEPERWSQVA
jgi:alkylhydroperoxidase family enzyme